MSEPASTRLSPLSCIVMRIVADHIHTVEALATASMDSVNYATLHSSYENMISLTHALHSSKNLTNWFTDLTTENEDLTLE
jgi:hypothetical protein